MTDKLQPLIKYSSTSGSKVQEQLSIILLLVNKFSMLNDNVSIIDYVSIRIDSLLSKPYNFAYNINIIGGKI